MDTGTNSCSSIALQPNGKIVAAGSCNVRGINRWVVARYDTSGNLDNSFGSGGRTITTFDTAYNVITSLVIQPDGKIIVGGLSDALNLGAWDFALIRYKTDGSVDSTFGINGKVSTQVGTGYDCVNDLALQVDGKIIAAGVSNTKNAYDAGIVRYNKNGSVDSSFGINGKVITDIGTNYESANKIVLQSDQKIVVTARTNQPAGWILRYKTDGTIDSTFSNDGKLRLDSITVGPIVIQGGGKIVVGGQDKSGIKNFGLARVTSNGTMDSTFGTNGIVITPIDSGAIISSLLSLPKGKMVAAGTVKIAGNTDFALVKYTLDFNLGIIDFTATKYAQLIYPNPIDKHATLEYTLNQEENILIRLLDSQGKEIMSFVRNEKQEKGNHKLAINLPDGLSPGFYFVNISSPNGQVSIKLIK